MTVINMRSQIVDVPPTSPGPDLDIHEADDIPGGIEKPDLTPHRQDAFGDEEHAEIKYKVTTHRSGIHKLILVKVAI